MASFCGQGFNNLYQIQVTLFLPLWGEEFESAFRAACLEEFRNFGVMNNPNCDSPCDLLGLTKDQCLVHP